VIERRSNPAATAPFRILSLAGGGYLGLYSAAVLEQLEKQAGEPLARRFDLIAGTSVGGILALALAYEIPMERLVALFREHGTEVFSPRAAPRGAVTRLLDLSRSVLGPKYSGAVLRNALVQHFGDRTLDQALHSVVVPAVDVTHSTTKIFKTPHGSASLGDQDVAAVDVAMATSAAPSYFPAVRIDGVMYADGGMFAVAPDQIALHEAEHFLGIDPQRVTMLSVGTATVAYRPPEGIEENSGAVGWLSDGRLLLTLVSVQQQHVQAMIEDRLGGRYLHLDAAWPPQGGLGIDVATPAAGEILIELARGTMQSEAGRRAGSFIGRR